MMSVFVPRANADQMLNQQYPLWKEVNHEIFGARHKKVWDFQWAVPKGFEREHLVMWLH